MLSFNDSNSIKVGLFSFTMIVTYALLIDTKVYNFTNSFIADSCSRLWEVPRFYPTETYDVGIVLGGIADYDKITKAHNFNKHADRIIDAKQLYHQGKIKKIFISGGNGTLFNDGYIEANAMRDYLLLNKIPSKDINKTLNKITFSFK